METLVHSVCPTGISPPFVELKSLNGRQGEVYRICRPRRVCYVGSWFRLAKYLSQCDQPRDGQHYMGGLPIILVVAVACTTKR